MALGTTLPIWPALIFTYLEPLSLLVGYYVASTTPSTFVSDQIPSTPTTLLTPIPSSALVLAHSMGNVFVLLAGLAVLCTAVTRDAKVTKWYLAIVAGADVGHIYSSYRIMGPGVFWDFAAYNDTMWGNIGFSAFLHVTRVATLLGLFGRVGWA
ncbi:hypothetical protein P153DRAFT_393365 [Dothidotthia symphoricarpi CBS 119687]|uniref:DUF7704 domain-containing protein n=1 Tax=Dothidotthia symphoricarpi CBS 119687 TaxID=1392245 RepID=A0A6A6AQS3_9PLEO|nr:uncharacterized protein P153DRAFT_393365 [Dothidotthia symphoricarpi CBS 119687]KAF2133553.1 hypothetical protein P153DRAFT_393365 [Dothidotthia symphoricarpi CBS 119687]